MSPGRRILTGRQKTGKQTITLTDYVILSAKDTEKRDESENEWVGGGG